MRPLFKICGLMRKEDVIFCCQTGVDICGFVTEYPADVPWNLNQDQCAALLQFVTLQAKSCIVTGGSREKILALALALKPDYVQLHYHETLADTAFLVHELSPYGIGVIKTIPVDEEERLRQFGTSDLALCTRKLCEAGVYALLVDSRGPSNAAGVSTAADRECFRCVRENASCPVMLGGGITPENCFHVIVKDRPDIIDVMTGVETMPGKKVPSRIATLIKNSCGLF